MTAIDAGQWAVLEAVREAMDQGRLLVPPPDFASAAPPMSFADASSEVLERHARSNAAPLHVYVHVPLCEERCSFCMYFYSAAGRTGSRASRCAQQIVDLVEAVAPERPRPAAAAYVGGGTPSVLSADELTSVLGTLFRHFPPEPQARVTVEMSPLSSSPEKIEAVVASGANRLSFGVQSFDAGVLARMHRQPTDPTHLRRCLESGVRAGAVDVNVDVLGGVEGQPEGDVTASVVTLARMGVPCITIYRHRPLPSAGVELRGGSQAYLAGQRAETEGAVDAVAGLGYETAGELGAESVRLFRSDHLWAQPRLPDRNCYRTQHDALLDSHLLGLGSGAQSFAGGELSFTCPHVPNFDGVLAGRAVTARRTDSSGRYAMTVVRLLHWNRRIADDDLHDGFPDRSLATVYGAELEWLQSVGAVRWSGSAVQVRCTEAEWALYEKVLYPVSWLERALGAVEAR